MAPLRASPVIMSNVAVDCSSVSTLGYLNPYSLSTALLNSMMQMLVTLYVTAAMGPRRSAALSFMSESMVAPRCGTVRHRRTHAVLPCRTGYGVHSGRDGTRGHCTFATPRPRF